MEASDHKLGPASPPVRLLSFPMERLRGWQQSLLALSAAALLVGVGYLAANNYPNTSPPPGSQLERRIARVFAPPSQSEADDKLTGDLLVERFYILDVASGETYVADFLKGRIQGLQQSTIDNGGQMYMLLLDLRDLRRDRSLYAAYVSAVAAPTDRGYYVGLIAAYGRSDAFALNYDGSLPNRREEFRGLEGEDFAAFLLNQDFKAVTASTGLVSVRGYNFLLSNSERFPAFKEFGIDKAIFLSELLVVDTTELTHRTTMYRLLAQYPGAGR